MHHLIVVHEPYSVHLFLSPPGLDHPKRSRSAGQLIKRTATGVDLVVVYAHRECLQLIKIRRRLGCA